MKSYLLSKKIELNVFKEFFFIIRRDTFLNNGVLQIFN